MSILPRKGRPSVFVSLEGLAVLLDEGLQRHRRAAADRLDHVVGAGEDAGLVVAFQDSPSDQSEIPSRARSLMRNCPGFPDRAGNPPRLASQTPGVVTRKLRVMRNMPVAMALPSAEARGQIERRAMSSAMATSTTPSMAEKPRW